MYYYTIKEIEKLAKENGIEIVDFYRENKWIVIIFKMGLKIKIRDY